MRVSSLVIRAVFSMFKAVKLMFHGKLLDRLGFRLVWSDSNV